MIYLLLFAVSIRLLRKYKSIQVYDQYIYVSSNPFFIQFTLFDLTFLAHLAQSKEGMVLSRAHTMNLRRTAGAQCILALGANIGRLTNVQVSSCKQKFGT